MTAESTSASLVSRLAVLDKIRVPQGYYRSKLFTTSTTSNPLVAAANPLFSLLERLSASPSLPPIERIRDNIEHELCAFYSRVRSEKYAEELILIAQYLLSATIDELVGKNYLRLNGEPAEFKSFTASSSDDVGPQRRFFEMLDYLKDRTHQYLDLIELAYYCLILGFEGEQHLRPDGRQTLDNLIEELYQLIQQHRVHKPLRLFKQPSKPMPKKPPKTNLMITCFLVSGLLTSMYFVSHALLEHKAKAVLENHIVLAKLDH